MLDLDNTLADREGAVRAWIDEFRTEWGLPVEAGEWMLEADADGYAERKGVFESIRSRFGLDAPVDELLADYRRRVVELTAPTAGAVECLHLLRARGWITAIVSNGTGGQQSAKIDALSLRPLVDAVCISGDLGVEKPDAAIFEEAATRTGSTLDDAWMVGDSPHHDIEGAARLGLRTAWLRRRREWPAGPVTPTATIDSLGQLVSAIDGTNPR